jgi:hypothetical protein
MEAEKRRGESRAAADERREVNCRMHIKTVSSMSIPACQNR